jgi:serine/threonine protein kinase
MNPSTDTPCPGCFAAKGEANPCPHCGYDEQAPRSPLLLPHRALLHGQYLVGRILGKPGGFGITYLGWDQNLATRVAIKEFLPRELAGRAGDRATVAAHSHEDGDLFQFGLEQFLREARTLAQLDHPNIVRVRQFFEANGTAYLVMDYYQGLSLAEYLDQRGGRLPEEPARQLIMPVLDGLRAVHAKGFLHRDLKPQNIYLAHLESGGVRPILLDFGAARHALSERSRSLTAIITPGYAPFEQYHGKGHQGPWTDIYSTAAVLYRMVTGETPPEATERRDHDSLRPAADFGVSPTISSAIGEAMALIPEARPQTVASFQALLNAPSPPPPPPPPPPQTSPTPPAPAPNPTPPPTPAASSRLWIGVLVLVVVLAAGGVFAWRELAHQAHQTNAMDSQHQRDDRAWAAARSQDAVAAYRMYLATCATDGCDHQAEALTRLDALEHQEAAREHERLDDAAFARAEREGSGDSYATYLQQCAAHGCGHREEAEQAVARILRTALVQGLKELQSAAEQQAAGDEALYTAARQADTEGAYRQYLDRCADTGCGHQEEANRRLAELDQQRRAAASRQVEEGRRQAPVARLRAYLEYLAAHQVEAALACLNTPASGSRRVIENIGKVQVHDLQLKEYADTRATVWLDWTGTTHDGKQQRWRGPVPLVWNGADWKIETFKYLAKP